jgi:FkbM family methyltransferase
MTLAGKKNPAAVLVQALAYWWSLRQSGAFTLGDAWINWHEWLLPSRFAWRAAGQALAREARIEPVETGVHRVTLLNESLVFFWLGKVDNNVYCSIAQEFDPACPHFYTTPPIQLTSESLVLDVGACEGLFACRVLRQGLAAKVICFEPSERTATYLRRGAELNGVSDHIVTEIMAVSRQSGSVCFEEGDCPAANRIVTRSTTPGTKRIPAVTIDDYCALRRLRLGLHDLIKIDAEGADLDVLRGAEKLIRTVGPQIAVTTYHTENHAREILAYLKSVQPAYHFRLKGFTLFGPVGFFGGAKPRPVLLQAALKTGA